MIQVRVINSNKFKEVFALLDDGSTVTLVNERILNQLQIKTYDTGVNVHLNGIGGDNVLAISNRKVNLKISECR